jgi:hypothetical protein
MRDGLSEASKSKEWFLASRKIAEYKTERQPRINSRSRGGECPIVSIPKDTEAVGSGSFEKDTISVAMHTICTQVREDQV